MGDNFKELMAHYTSTWLQGRGQKPEPRPPTPATAAGVQLEFGIHIHLLPSSPQAGHCPRSATSLFITYLDPREIGEELGLHEPSTSDYVLTASATHHSECDQATRGTDHRS